MDATGKGRVTTRRRPEWTHDPERVGVYTLVTILIGWLVAMFAIQGVMIADHGYGLWLTSNPRIPHSIVKQIGVGNNIQAMMNATNKP
jgi:hypothetical protein